MLRHYACNKYKTYSIRNHYFKNGLFETDDPDVQRLIEGADGYGVFIHPVETPEEVARMKEIEEAARSSDGEYCTICAQAINNCICPTAVQGARGTMSNKLVRKGQVIGGKK